MNVSAPSALPHLPCATARQEQPWAAGLADEARPISDLPRAARVNLLDFDREALEAYLTRQGERRFRAQQLLQWIHQRGTCDFSAMHNLARSTRHWLEQETCVALPSLLREHRSADGTRKWLFEMEEPGRWEKPKARLQAQREPLAAATRNAIETVYIPEAGRATLCISSQLGCALDCAFCATGKQGFNRNLGTAEIIGQLWWANQTLRAEGIPPFDAPPDEEPVSTAVGAAATAAVSTAQPISNVVMMGMGEPLANFDAVVRALHLMLDDHAYGLSRRRVTVSTSGLVPAIDRLREACPVALAVSLHAPTDALRDQLVPINRKYPLRELMAACQRYLDAAPRPFITFEYVMLAGINDRAEDLAALLKLVRVVPCKLNLIPFNPFPGTGFHCSSPATIRHFQQTLIEAGYTTTVRKTRGDDIAAACGQLAGQVRDRTRRTAQASGALLSTSPQSASQASSLLTLSSFPSAARIHVTPPLRSPAVHPVDLFSG